LNPCAVSSSGIVANNVSRKCSLPNSRTSVSRVAAKSIFCRTGAASGTYVAATKRGEVSYRRRMMYRASLGSRCGASCERFASKDDEVVGRTSFGVSASEVMVARMPKSSVEERSLVNSETSSLEAVGRPR
jgi:hypothetical protein